MRGPTFLCQASNSQKYDCALPSSFLSNLSCRGSSACFSALWDLGSFCRYSNCAFSHHLNPPSPPPTFTQPSFPPFHSHRHSHDFQILQNTLRLTSRTSARIAPNPRAQPKSPQLSLLPQIAKIADSHLVPFLDRSSAADIHHAPILARQVSDGYLSVGCAAVVYEGVEGVDRADVAVLLGGDLGKDVVLVWFDGLVFT